MKILTVPDSFKGSLSSFEVCNCIKDALGDKHSVECVAFADGGEGFAMLIGIFREEKRFFLNARTHSEEKQTQNT